MQKLLVIKNGKLRAMVTVSPQSAGFSSNNRDIKGF